MELMKLRNAQSDKTVIPSDNTDAVSFLKNIGYQELPTRGMRMIRGEPLQWEPQGIFSRTGGNVG